MTTLRPWCAHPTGARTGFAHRRTQFPKLPHRGNYAYLSVCKTDLDNQQCANTHEDNFASGKHIIIIANILFFEAIVPYLEGSTKFPILVLVILVVCLRRIHCLQ